MSAFLGPIHLKMYDRILYQDAMSRAILDLAAKKGWGVDLASQVDAQAPAASDQPLETIIDQGNIHGWLSKAVMGCERRFALAVCGALADHPERLDELKRSMNDLGKASGLPPAMDAEQAYQAIHSILLDGMPCDFPFIVTESSPNAVAWQVANCPHALYWNQGGCCTEVYYDLRDAWMDGALSGSGIIHLRLEPFVHILKREGSA